jgi:hypothetical protein
MNLTIRTLHTDGSVTTSTETARRYRRSFNALVHIGSRLRAADPTVAACRADVGAAYPLSWIGSLSALQMAAVARAERDNPNW